MRGATAAAAFAVVASISLSIATPVSGASAPSPPAGGSVRFIERPTSATVGSIIITGAIGDYGTVVSIDKNGASDPHGSYLKIGLKKGGFKGNATALVAKQKSTSFPINRASCSSQGSISAPVSLFGGTGLYQNISGTVTVTETFAWVLGRHTSGAQAGQCNGHDVAKMVVTSAGSGKVKF
jgi:hypothetical protein